MQVIIGTELVNKATDYIVRLYSCYLPPDGSPWETITVFYEHLLGELYLSLEADSLFLVVISMLGWEIRQIVLVI